MSEQEDLASFGLLLLRHAAPTYAIADGAIVPGAPPVAPAPPPPPPAPAKQPPPLLSPAMLQRAIGASAEPVRAAVDDDAPGDAISDRAQLQRMFESAARLVREAGAAKREAVKQLKKSKKGKR